MGPNERVWQNPNSADVRVVVSRPGTDQIARGARRSIGARREIFYCNGSILRGSSVLSLAMEEATVAKRERQIQRDADAAARLRRQSPGTVPADAKPLDNRERELPSIQVEADPCAFAEALAWLYGLPLEVSLEKMLEWPIHGCLELESARALGIDSLEHAVRRLIFEAASWGKVRLLLALMLVSHHYELQQEFAHCCAELARSGGHGATEALLTDVPFPVISGLMESSAWIVDHEDDVLEVFELWMRSQFKQRGQMVQWPTVAHAAGTWDIRWSVVSKDKLQMLARFGVIPAGMYEDCEAQVSNEVDRQQQLRYFIKAQKEVSRMQTIVKAKRRDVDKRLQAFDESMRDVEDLQSRLVSGKQVTRSGISQALSRATQTMNQCRIQLAISKESLGKAETALEGHKDTLAKCAPESKKDNDTKYVWGEAADRLQQEDMVWRILGKEASLWHRCVSQRGRQTCSWLERRRCHHVHMEGMHGWRRHISSMGMSRDRLLIKVGVDHEEDGSKVAHLVGSRLVARGRHELLVRYTRRCAVSPSMSADIMGEGSEPVRGLRFGVAAYNMQPGYKGKSAWFGQSRGGFVRTSDSQSLTTGSRTRAKVVTSAAPADLLDDAGPARTADERPIRRMFTSATEAPFKYVWVPEDAVNSALSGGHFNLDQKKSKLPAGLSLDESESQEEDEEEEEEEETSERPPNTAKQRESVASITSARSSVDGDDAASSRRSSKEDVSKDLSGGGSRKSSARKASKAEARASKALGEGSDDGSSASAEFSWSDLLHMPGSAANPYDLDRTRGGVLQLRDKKVRILDLMILLVLDCESECLMFATEQIDCGPGLGPPAHEAAFLGRHSCLGRWSEDASLHSDLRLGAAELPKGKAFAFTIEIDAPTITMHCGMGLESHAQVEVLPQGACWPSWWVDFMDHTVDDCPSTGVRPAEAWGSTEASL